MNPLRQENRMFLKIEILCPHERCWKCDRIAKLINQLTKEYKPDVNILFIKDMDTMMTYPTWVLPALFINNRTIARGYVPDKKHLAGIIREIMIKK